MVCLVAATSGRQRWLPVVSPQQGKVLVTFGDSLTEGAPGRGSTRWPAVVAARLRASKRSEAISVVNEGIAGNRLLRDNAGVAGLTRFDADVLARSGVAWVTILIGINDIGFAGSFDPESPPVTAPQLVAGYQQLIRKARAAGVKVYGCTLLPFEGAMSGYHSAEKEAVRAAVNAWIRSPGAFDAVIDFDRVMRDPSRPTRLQPAYDSGDHLHPSDRGQQAMGDAVDLELFR